MFLDKLITRNYLINTLIPTILIGLILLILYFGINSYISKKNSETLLIQAKQNLIEISSREASSIDKKFNKVISISKILKGEGEKAFKNIDTISLAKEEFQTADNKMIYKVKNDGGSSAWFYATARVNENTFDKALKTRVFDSLFKTIVDTNDIIVASYFMGEYNFVRYYPFIENVYTQFDPDMNLSEFNFYYVANEKHNPKKETVWTEAYLDPAGLGWIITCASPVYHNGFLEGIMGIDITLEDIIKNILNLKLPWSAETFLVNENGKILAITDKAKKILHITEKKREEKIINEIVIKPEAFNLLNYKDEKLNEVFKELLKNSNSVSSITIDSKKYLLSSNNIKSTKWKLFILVDEELIYEPIYKLYNMSKMVGYFTVILVIIFFIFHILYLIKKSRSLSNQIAQPIKDLTNITKKIYIDMENRVIKKVNINEIDILTDNFINMMRELKKHQSEIEYLNKNLQLEVDRKTKELKRSEERYKTLFEKSADATLIIEDSKFVDCNSATLKLLKYDSKEEILNLAPFELSPKLQMDGKTSKQKAQEMIDLAIKNGSHRFEWIHKKSNNQEFFAEVLLTPIPIEDKIVIHTVWRDLTEKKKLEKEVELKNKRLKESKKQILDNIKFSAMIQNSILPEDGELKRVFKDYLLIWEPKDIVGGDIYLIEEFNSKYSLDTKSEFESGLLILVIDCTGHGVAGAFMTMIVKTLLKNIINKNNYNNPAEILKEFNGEIRELLKQNRGDSLNDSGFDGGVLFYKKRDNKVLFAGARTPLFYIQNSEVKTIKGDRHSIGYKRSNPNFEFRNHEIEINTKTYFYITTDGFLDQIGGKKSLSFGKRRFNNLLKKNYKKPFSKQKDIILNTLKEYQGLQNRRDDVTIVGFSIENNQKEDL